ncbi:17.3 kDa class II heat shock protein-like [Quillaja saponaria]|uniref:17.3 kDa class II heat shock protein-like n=1 Tax=Quillaja saponaria TaxID=32244 RepID=A0AAD7LZM7_QUISA|nr:17.3 kDa class II heat shock protein-like [Quillaja saponaria]
MAATPAYILEYPNAYRFVVDMPGLRPDQISVRIEDDTLVVDGERKREKDKEHKESVKFLRMERRLGKYVKKFELSANANTEKISTSYQDGVLTVIVEKRPAPEPKKPKTVEVQIGQQSS